MNENPATPATPATPTTSAAPALGGRDYLRLVGIGAAIGIPAALVAVAFQYLVHVLETFLWDDLPEKLGTEHAPWWLVLVLLVVGALIVWAARSLLPGNGGHEPIDGLSAVPTPLSYAPGVALAALGSLAFGAVLGPEAPLIALGSVVGMVAVRLWKVTGPGAQVLSASGSFSAISALFGGPVVAGALLLEAGVSAGAAIVPVLLPGAVAAAIGYVLIVGIGDWGGIPMHAMSVPNLPAYPDTRLVDLVLAVVIAVVVAGVVFVIRTSGHRLMALRSRLGLGPSLVVGALVVGILAILVEALGGSQDDVLFSGQAAIPALLGQDSAGILVLIVVAKGIAYAACLGLGFRGGPIFPAIFLAIGVAVLIGLPFGLSPTVALAIGTACGMAAFSRLLFSSLVFVLLLVGAGSAAVMPAAVLAAATAWLAIKAIEKRFEPAHAPLSATDA